MCLIKPNQLAPSVALVAATLLRSIVICPAQPTAWSERIVNGDGTINWKEYQRVAEHAGELEERDFLLGPKYSYYHPQMETFRTLALQGDASGWDGPPNYRKYLDRGTGGPDEADWYAQAGPLIYVADDPANAGVVSAGNGECYLYHAGVALSSGFWYKVNWQSRRCCYLYPDPPELRQPDWRSPIKPVAVASPTGTPAIAQYVAFQSGFIGTFAVDKCAYTHQWGLRHYRKLQRDRERLSRLATPSRQSAHGVGRDAMRRVRAGSDLGCYQPKRPNGHYRGARQSALFGNQESGLEQLF